MGRTIMFVTLTIDFAYLSVSDFCKFTLGDTVTVEDNFPRWTLVLDGEAVDGANQHLLKVLNHFLSWKLSVRDRSIPCGSIVM